MGIMDKYLQRWSMESVSEETVDIKWLTPGSEDFKLAQKGLIDQVKSLEEEITEQAKGSPLEKIVSEAAETRTDRFVKSLTQSKLMVAEMDGKLVGFLTASIAAPSGIARFQIERFFVAQEYRDKGIAKAMLDKAAEKAKSQGCALLSVSFPITSSDAESMYSEQGFTDFHRTMVREV